MFEKYDRKFVFISGILLGFAIGTNLAVMAMLLWGK